MTLPEILEHSCSGNTAHVVVVAPASLKYFDGHFPGTPILPGVVQIGWAQHIAERVFNVPLTVNGMRKIKFMQLIRPDRRLALELQLHEGRLEFRYSDGERVFSSGILDVESRA